MSKLSGLYGGGAGPYRTTVWINGVEHVGDVYPVPAQPTATTRTDLTDRRARGDRTALLPRQDSQSLSEWLSPPQRPVGDTFTVIGNGFDVSFRVSHNGAMLIEVRDK